MKFRFFPICIFAVLASAFAHAENLVDNGDFESGDGTAFFKTPPWYNRGEGLNQGTNARSAEGAVITPAYSASVNDRYQTTAGKFGPIVYAQKTSHIIQAGDSFSLIYEWRPADKHWQKSTDTIRFVLYATENDKLGGPVVWSSELTSDLFKGDFSSVMLVEQKSDVVDEFAVGKALFVMFYGLDTDDSETGSTHWARVDNIEIQANNDSKAP